MRRILTLWLLLMTILAMTTVAHADAISDEAFVMMSVGGLVLVGLLVAGAIAVTVWLLGKFRKKK